MSEHNPYPGPETGHDLRLSAFTEALFGHLGRADQRRWAQVYLQGLLTARGRKSVRRLASAVSGSPTASQSLQQFVNVSPWDWTPARRELMRLAEGLHAPRAWTIATAVLPKRGEHSCGVHRRFDPAAGRTVNCQVGLGAFLASGAGQIPVEWRLLLSGHWGEDGPLRERARIPGSLREQPFWAMALGLVDALSAHTAHPRVPVVTDVAEQVGANWLAAGLNRRGHGFVIAVPANLRVLPHAATARHRGEPAHGPASHAAVDARTFLHRHGARHQEGVTLLDGRRGSARLLSEQVCLPGSRQAYRIFTERRSGEDRFARLWLTNLYDRPLDQLAALTELLQGTAPALASLERDHGMLDFEGRSFPGWHHHMTLVSAAYAFRRLGGRIPAAAADAKPVTVPV